MKAEGHALEGGWVCDGNSKPLTSAPRLSHCSTRVCAWTGGEQIGKDSRKPVIGDPHLELTIPMGSKALQLWF